MGDKPSGDRPIGSSHHVGVGSSGAVAPPDLLVPSTPYLGLRPLELLVQPESPILSPGQVQSRESKVEC
jgi:hypothetical protein